MIENESNRGRLKELAFVFLKLGTTAFGGPAAHIAMMEEEVVRRRQWLSREDFLDLLGATNLIPGPNSTELAIHIGHRRAGWPGLWVAGLCFIVPAALIVTLFSWAYVTYGTKPEASSLLYGIKPVIIAVILQALWGLSRTAIKSRDFALIGAMAAVIHYLGVHELIVLFGTALLVFLRERLGHGHLFDGASALVGGSLATNLVNGTVASPLITPSLSSLFLFFLKIGSVLFGSGYVLLAFLRADLVERLHWLTESQLLDAIAVGQITPGPVFTTATFIGYIVAGAGGAWIATGGIFLPAFFFVAISGPLIPKIRKSKSAGAFLDGLNLASLALMTVVTLQLTKTSIVDMTTLSVMALSAVLLFRFKANSAWLVLGGALFGILKAQFL